MKNLAVLVSGTGSLLQAIIDDGLRVKVVIADRECPALEIARKAGIEAIVVPRKRTPDAKFDDVARLDFTARLVHELEARNVDFIAMAGFMTELTETIFERYEGRILNTHPGILPEFKGKDAVGETLEAHKSGSREIRAGFSIHHATRELDGGPALAQGEVPIKESDTREELHERIKTKEREIYPKVIRGEMERLR